MMTSCYTPASTFKSLLKDYKVADKFETKKWKQCYNINVYLSMLKKRSENCLSMREFSSPTPVYFARLKKCIRISRKTKTMLSTTLF